MGFKNRIKEWEGSHTVVVFAADMVLNASFHLPYSLKYVAARLTPMVSSVPFGRPRMAIDLKIPISKVLGRYQQNRFGLK